jgi:hypothetical protein
MIYLTREWLIEHPEGIVHIRAHLVAIAKILQTSIKEEVDFMTQGIRLYVTNVKSEVAPLVYEEKS